MTRYIKRPRSWVSDPLFSEDAGLVPDLTVDEHVPRFTGLLDAAGDEIWKQPRPAGFDRDEEW